MPKKRKAKETTTNNNNNNTNNNNDNNDNNNNNNKQSRQDIPYSFIIPKPVVQINLMAPNFSWRDLSIFARVCKNFYNIAKEEKSHSIVAKVIDRFGYQISFEEKIKLLEMKYFDGLEKSWVERYQQLYDKYNHVVISPQSRKEGEKSLTNKKTIIQLLHEKRYAEAKDSIKENKIKVYFLEQNGTSPIAIAAANGELDLVIYFICLGEKQKEGVLTYYKYIKYYGAPGTALINPLIAALRNNRSQVAQFLLKLDLTSYQHVIDEAFKFIILNNDVVSLKLLFDKINPDSIKVENIYWALQHSMNKKQFVLTKWIYNKHLKRLLKIQSDNSHEDLGEEYNIAYFLVHSLIANTNKMGEHIKYEQLYDFALDGDNVEVFRIISDFITSQGGGILQPKVVEHSINRCLDYGMYNLILPIMQRCDIQAKWVVDKIQPYLSKYLEACNYQKYFEFLKLLHIVVNKCVHTDEYSELQNVLEQTKTIEGKILEEQIKNNKITENEVSEYYKLRFENRKGVTLNPELKLAIEQQHYWLIIVILQVMVRFKQTFCLTMSGSWQFIITGLKDVNLINHYFKFMSEHAEGMEFEFLYNMHRNSISEKELLEHCHTFQQRQMRTLVLTKDLGRTKLADEIAALENSENGTDATNAVAPLSGPGR